MGIHTPWHGFTVQAGSTISAPIEEVWTVLTDLEQYVRWNTFVPSMQSTLEVGSILTMKVQLHPRYRFHMRETVTAVEPGYKLAWKARYPAWYLHSERVQTLLSLDANTTHYETHETFTGLMAPLLQLLLGRYLQRQFETVARELKEHTEALAMTHSPSSQG